MSTAPTARAQAKLDLPQNRPIGRETMILSEVPPLGVCLAAGLTLALTPAVIWRLKTGTWACLQETDSLYYLQFAARVYNGDSFGDPAIPGGVTFYPSLQFVPAAVLARALGIGVFSIEILWMVFIAVGVTAGLYFVFRHFVGSLWPAAGCTIVCLSDYGFVVERSLRTGFAIVLSALRHHYRYISLPWEMMMQWRIPNPGLDLPFIFLQVLALARARERRTSFSIWLSGATFGLLFYVYFYAWTMAAMALLIALLFDRAARGVYFATLVIGGFLGLPELLHNFHVRHFASAEAMQRFGLFLPIPSWKYQSLPLLSLLAVIIVAVWMWRTRRFELTYLWALLLGGIVLSRSRIVTGVFVHEYHWNWLWGPFRMILPLILVFIIVREMSSRLRAFVPIASTFTAMVFMAGLYISVLSVVRSSDSIARLETFERYRAQRTALDVAPLVTDSTIAGSRDFCELAAIDEGQLPLDGYAIPISMVIDREEWQARVALNAYVEEKSKAQFEAYLNSRRMLQWYWSEPADERRRSAAIGGFMRTYDSVVKQPARYLDRFSVRYVALNTGQKPPAYLEAGWTLLQAGPYWQIWERVKPLPRDKVGGPDLLRSCEEERFS